MIDNNTFFNILRCPLTKEKLIYSKDNNYLISEKSGIKYNISGSIPILLSDHSAYFDQIIKDTAFQDFDYIDHYQNDAELFDYFEERRGATKDDERRIYETIESAVSKKVDNSTILDVGCGRAWVAQKFGSRGFNVISMDLSLKNTTEAIRRYPFKNHYAVVADAFNLPFADNSIDYIIASEIIEHVANPGLFVTELFRCIKPGGKLIVTTPYKEKLSYSLCIHCNKMTPVNAHLHSFDSDKLIDLNKSSDLKNSQITIFGNKLLLFSRSYILLRFLPYQVWRIIDKIVSLLINNQAHIMIEYAKSM
jgi:2-polyprenyl-3-methyl-5-hydroxy-6-metoxy-1,4-benzoquinol methylase/uncharacterized protein YbaR (Trm112 family)